MNSECLPSKARMLAGKVSLIAPFLRGILVVFSVFGRMNYEKVCLQNPLSIQNLKKFLNPEI